MDVTDETKVTRVWSRVMNQPEAISAPEAPACGRRITPEQVAELMRQELDSAAVYRYLACRVRGGAKGLLQRLSEQERCHAKKLGAYYFLLTGKKYCPCRPAPVCVTCINETLRLLYEKELADAKKYRELSAFAAEQGCILQSLSRDECEHAQQIFCILQNTL